MSALELFIVGGRDRSRSRKRRSDAWPVVPIEVWDELQPHSIPQESEISVGRIIDERQLQFFSDGPLPKKCSSPTR